jgi:sec-independent protein translocase protein TatA
MEMMIIMGIAVLMFGKRLPEVGRSLGKGIVEFKKGLRGVEDELGDITGLGSGSSHSSSSSYSYADTPRYESPAKETTYSDTAVPKFELPSPPEVPPTEYRPQSETPAPSAATTLAQDA